MARGGGLCWLAVWLSLGVVGCGGDGSRPLSNLSTWQLYTASTTTFSQHAVIGKDGQSGNRVSCTNTSDLVDIEFYDAGRAVDIDGDGMDDLTDRKASLLKIRANLNNSSNCLIRIREVPATLAAPAEDEPFYTDDCSEDGGCVLSVETDDNGRHVEGTLECDGLTQDANPGGDPIELSNFLLGGGRTEPAVFSIDNCKLL